MDSQEALQQLLRWKRGQISPTELGWPKRPDRGRRTSGLSQAQVAQLLYVTERTYADLERGKLSAPSSEFLDSVARVLRMDERERHALYVYSLGFEPPTPMDRNAGMQVSSAWEESVKSVSGHPCYVNDVAWNVLAHNDEFLRMFPQEPSKPPRLPERNLIRWMLLREDAREHHLVDWETQWAGPVATALRTAVASYPDNDDLQQLDAEVNEDPVAGPIYRRSVTYVLLDGSTRPVRHAGYTPPSGEFDHRDRCCDRHQPSHLGFVTMCAAQPSGSPGARFILLVFNPHA